MFVAKQKRRENIAEYILYLWQLEDLLRALEFSRDKINGTLVAPYKELDGQGQKQLLDWYCELGNLLKMEDKVVGGHLEHTLHLVGELNDLHQHLLLAPVGRKYAVQFALLAPELPKLREHFPSQASDMELCFRALYSVILCRMKGLEQSQYVTDVLEVVSPVVGQLAAIFRGAEDGTVDLYKEED